ncbi:hypothetical protein CWI37_0303p0030 [Hamiltosporidium tvaerminnensis]|uniref:Uncharacterized protein n=1 Tax=Hamiltosporidium tvaerminnensis TaxID=1176355 RepID=A0A4Q9L6Y3_9MICR|nr:hypothetical protein CWI37_0303p0030 [Hamiltosporidium tvaerminnensis]
MEENIFKLANTDKNSNVQLQFGGYFPLETKINLPSENSLSACYCSYREKVSDNALNQHPKLHQKRSTVTAKNSKSNKDSKSNNETIKTSIDPNDKTFEDTRLNSYKPKISNREPIQQILETKSEDSKTLGDEKKDKIKLKDINESKGIVDSVHAQHISEDSNEKEKENKNDILNKYFNWYKKNVNEDTQYNDILYVLHDPTQNEALMNHNIDINTIVDQNGNPIPDAKSKREILVNFLLYYKSFVNPNGQDHFNNIGHTHAKKRHDIIKKTYAISDINKNFKEDVNQNIQKPINYSDLDSAETHSNEKYDKFVQIFQNQENHKTLNSLNNNNFGINRDYFPSLNIIPSSQKYTENENHDIFPPQYFSNTYPGATEDKIDFYPNTTESNMTKSKYPDNKSYMPGVHSNIYRFSNTDDKIDDSGIPYVFDRNNLEVNVMFREEGADSHSNIGAEYKNPNVSYTNYFNILSGLDSNTTKNTKNMHYGENTDKAIKNFNIAHQKTHLCTLHMSESEYFTYGNLNYGVIKEQGENNDARILGNIESGNILNKNSYYNSLYDDINSNTTKDNESTNLSNSAIFPVQNPSTDSRNFLQQKMKSGIRKANEFNNAKNQELNMEQIKPKA